MSYGREDADMKRRSRIATELDRRDFWKECFKIALASPFNECSVSQAKQLADQALTDYDCRFGGEVK